MNKQPKAVALIFHKKDQSQGKRNNALWAAETLGIKLHIIDIVEDYKKIVLNPKHGYGKHLKSPWPNHSGSANMLKLVRIDGDSDPSDFDLIARLSASFCSIKDAKHVRLSHVSLNGRVTKLAVTPMDRKDINPNWYVSA